MIYKSLEEHDANPPSTWAVRPSEEGHGRYALIDKRGLVLGVYVSKEAAEKGKVNGMWTAMYDDETRWYAGERWTGPWPWTMRTD